MQKHRTLIYISLVVIALAIIVAVFGLIGFGKIWNNLTTVGWDGFAIYFVITLASLSLTGFGWWLSLRSYKIHISLLRTAIAHLIAFGINLFIPSMYIGGEPFRAYYIGKIYKISKNKILGTAMFAKFVELIVLVLFIYAGTIILVTQPESTQIISPTLSRILIAIDVIIGVVLAGILWGAFRNLQVLTRLLTVIRKFNVCTNFLDKTIPKIQQMEEINSLVFRHNWRMGFLVMLVCIVSVGITFVKPALLFYFLIGQSRVLTVQELAFIFIVTQILLSVHLTPAGLGFVEGGNLLFFSYINITSDVAAAYLIISRLIDFLIAGGGCYLMIHYSLTNIGKGKISTIEDVYKEMEKTDAATTAGHSEGV